MNELGDLELGAPAESRTSKDRLAGRITTEGARAEGPCICPGCGSCRGEAGYPCGMLATVPEYPELCRWCIAERARAVEERPGRFRR